MGRCEEEGFLGLTFSRLLPGPATRFAGNRLRAYERRGSGMREHQRAWIAGVESGSLLAKRDMRRIIPAAFFPLLFKVSSGFNGGGALACSFGSSHGQYEYKPSA
jgi:hypothetical protein